MRVPEKGFYYHYKHNDKDGIENYAYEVLGVGKNTEDESFTVIYRPLYVNSYFNGIDFSSRPLKMFMENVTKDDKTFPRFQKITDEEIINKLTKIRDGMYK